jgi:carboxypeptidase T
MILSMECRLQDVFMPSLRQGHRSLSRSLNGRGILRVFLILVVASQGITGGARAEIPLSRTYTDVKGFLRGIVARFPERAKIVELGLSDSGEMIEALSVGDGSIQNLVVATHHGNEYGSAEVAKAVAMSLAENPIRGQTVTVVPVLNIGGFNRRSRWESAGSQSFDPNRDYPGPCGTEGPFHLKSTAALARFVEQRNIIASATLHTFYPAVVYPWGMSTHDLSTPYDGLFQALVGAATAESRYPVGNSAELIYPADGTFEDYAYWKHGVWSLLFELGYSHSPSAAAVAEMQRVNVPGIRRMLEQAPSQRADNHGFSGKCDRLLRTLDRHDE